MTDVGPGPTSPAELGHVGRERVPALGGERLIPVPDQVATAYLLLALRIDQRDPGFVDAYIGPADLKARVDIEQPPSLERLSADVDALRTRVTDDIDDADRRAWLLGQLDAIEVRLSVLAGAPVPYLEQVERAFQWRPRRRDERELDAAAVEIDRLLPGDDPVEARLAAWDDRLTVPPERLEMVAGRLLEAVRERAAVTFGVPEGETCRLRLVRGQPWSGYDWYDGGGRSRIDVNQDLPMRAPELLDLLAHETYAGHHLEHAWKERSLVEEAGWLEHSVTVLLAPEGLISEGLADVGPQLLVQGTDRVDLLAATFEWAGLEVGSSRATAREAAERAFALAPPRRRLQDVSVNAGLLRWVDGADSDETLAYLRRYGRLSEARARKRLEFIEHPSLRIYVHVYAEGAWLIRRWLDATADGDRPGAFRRLLREAMTPHRLVAEAGLAEAGLAESAGER
jgi:hypothetical protein